MVDINDNDYKLLKMNESLLSKLSSDDIKFKETIDTYKELAIKIDRSNYNAMKIDALSKAKEKVKYTLEINVRKDKDGNWEVAGLTSSDRKKIQGMY